MKREEHKVHTRWTTESVSSRNVDLASTVFSHNEDLDGFLSGQVIHFAVANLRMKSF